MFEYTVLAHFRAGEELQLKDCTARLSGREQPIMLLRLASCRLWLSLLMVPSWHAVRATWRRVSAGSQKVCLKHFRNAIRFLRIALIPQA